MLDFCALQAAVPAGPEAPGIAATDSVSVADTETVSEAQLVRGGGEQRTIFKLALEVSSIGHSCLSDAVEPCCDAAIACCTLHLYPIFVPSIIYPIGTAVSVDRQTR
jgi:hypothetical protein